MSSDLKIEANRQNAQHSTGPTTPEGRAAVRLNGIKHGLCAETLILPGEDPAAFEARLDSFQAEHQPATPTEELLVRQIAMADWRLSRLHRMEAAIHKVHHKRRIEDRDERDYRQADADSRLAMINERDAYQNKVLINFQRYEVRLERSFRSALQELRRLRADRRADQTQAAPVESPKDKPSPKIISIETVERPPAPNQHPTSNIQHPPFGAPSPVDPAPTTDK